MTQPTTAQDSSANPQTTRLKISGMQCAGCVSSVEKALCEVPGVEQASVNFAEHSAQIVGSVESADLVHAVENAGYSAEPEAAGGMETPAASASELQEIKLLWYKAAVAGLLGFGLMLAGMAGWLPPMLTADGKFFWSTAGVVSLFVMIYAGEHFYRGAWKSLQNRRANMDTLVALGTASAWIYSMLVVLFPEWVQARAVNAYFEAALMIIAFINFGQGLEAQARRKTGNAIRKLLDLQPPVARVITQQGERMLAVAQLSVGDRIRVLSGDKVPVDGVVESGRGVVNESMLSGESMPVSKQEGDQVIGGSINQNGSFVMLAQQVGEHTLLAQIVARVRAAQSSKPEIARMVDQIAAFFVPTVLIVALLNAVLWLLLYPGTVETPAYTFALETTMAILIIACPCALGLATPISIVIGIGKAAQGGVLVRNAEALYRCRKLKVIAFDKTGTLTKGEPEVTQVHCVANSSRDQVVQWAGSLEAQSNHPLAKTITEYSNKQGHTALPVTEVSEQAGSGVSGVVDGRRLLIGSEHYLQSQGINCESAESTLEQIYSDGQSAVLLACDDQLVAVFGVADPLKPGVYDSIRMLKKLGMRVVILSGDNTRAVATIAEQLEVDEFHAQLLPEDKADFIMHQRRRGAEVAMVGDGINDAPALASADVGFALGAGTDIAIESADITLIGDSTHEVVKAVQIARATITNIKQNLFGAFIYNSLSIPIAAGILFLVGGPMLNPMYAGMAMALSSLTVVLNASRLRQFKFSNPVEKY